MVSDLKQVDSRPGSRKYVTDSLSVVIPAYNESLRIKPPLDDICEYLSRSELNPHWEVIVIDDGSRDGTGDVIQTVQQHYPQVRLITHPQNAGKGAAVRSGVLASRYDFILLTDADGATPIQQEQTLRQAITGGADLAVGSRTAADPAAIRKRSFPRRCTGELFSILARWIIPVPVQDPQCGFKMFPRSVAQRLFQISVESGYLFDLEILYLAERSGYSISECAVHWQEIPGSKIHLFADSWNMLLGLRRVRRNVEVLVPRTKSPNW